MLDRTNFEQVIEDKVVTLYLLSEEQFKNTTLKTVEIPFYIPDNKERLFEDFKKAVALKLKEIHGYEMSDFIPNKFEESFKGIIRFVNITKR